MSRGRPQTYTDDTKVGLSTPGASRIRMNKDSDRRAIMNVLIDNGGSLTLEQIDEHFGYDIRRTVLALLRAGWLRVVE